MRILTVSFFDDNYGDMLIRICFDRLLKVAMKNLGFDELDYVIYNMNIKEIDADRIAGADLVLFSGGALFGFNNLGSFDAIDTITAIADEHSVPVVFSSIGINNMHANEQSGERLNEILMRRCIKAMSVRESAEIFVPFAEGCDFEIVSVCDPAVWAKHVYRKDVQEVRKAKDRKIVGLNIVRGGLFKANFKAWSLDDEAKFIKKLVAMLEEKEIDYRLFSNGSVLDTNSMMYIAKHLEIPDEKLICPDSTKEVVRAIAGFDAVTAIRLHAGIISYALDIPSINLVWNEKIPHFYRNIGHPERAIEIGGRRPLSDDPDGSQPKLSLAEITLQSICELLYDVDYHADDAYLMSLYRYLFTTLGKIFHRNTDDKEYPFETVSHMMGLQESDIGDDITDYRTKLSRSRYCYHVLSERNHQLRYRNIKLQRYLREIYRSPYYRSYHFLTGLLKIREPVRYEPAVMEDLDRVRDLFNAATANLQIQKIPQWDENYPTDADFTPDIQSGRMQLVYKGKRLAAVYTLTGNAPDRFLEAQWNHPDESSMTLIRLALHPDCEAFGMPKKILTHIITELKDAGIQNLHAEVCQRNTYDSKLYQKMGFVKVGETILFGKLYDLMELHL